jgi:enamine deaminase RidA (YjgF/YER057c/UK114 family)
MTPEAKLAAMGIHLPDPPKPIASYVPCVRSGGLLFVSGQLPLGPDGKINPEHVGKLGRDLFHEAGQEAAKLCAINVLAQARAELGGLGRVERCVRLGGFLNCVADFTALPAIMNAASDLMTAAFGERGRHARTTIGVMELPLGAAVEIEAIFAVT